MTIQVYKEDSEDPPQIVIDRDRPIEFSNDTNFNQNSRPRSLENIRPSVVFSENYFKVPADRRQSVALSEKNLFSSRFDFF